MEANAPQVDAKTISMAKTQKEEDSEGKDNGESKQQQAPMNDESIKQAMKELSKKQANFTSEFGIHEKTHRLYHLYKHIHHNYLLQKILYN